MGCGGLHLSMTVTSVHCWLSSAKWTFSLSFSFLKIVFSSAKSAFSALNVRLTQVIGTKNFYEFFVKLIFCVFNPIFIEMGRDRDYLKRLFSLSFDVMGFLDLFFKAFHSVSNEASLDKYLKSKPEFSKKNWIEIFEFQDCIKWLLNTW